MQITTTRSIEGKRITRYCGVVTGEAILRANLFKDLFAGNRDLVGNSPCNHVFQTSMIASLWCEICS
jgi:uncharacterized protein YbjQ (UPF0145 family)